MKKHIFCYIPITLLLIVISIISVAAGESVIFQSELKEENNNVITVEYKLTGSKNIAAMGLELEYDSDCLSVVDVQQKDILERGMLQYNSDNKGKVIVSYISTSQLASDGVFLEIDYQILAYKSTNLTINITELVNDKYEKVSNICQQNNIDLSVYQESANSANKELSTKPIEQPSNKIEIIKATQPTSEVNQKDKDESYTIKEKVTEKHILDFISKSSDLTERSVYRAKLEDNYLIDQKDEVIAVYLEDDNGNIHKANPIINEETGNVEYPETSTINNNIYIVKSDNSLEHTESTFEFKDSNDDSVLEEPDSNIHRFLWVIIMIVLIALIAIIVIIFKKVRGKT